MINNIEFMENDTSKLQTVRIGTDITIRARLIDSGVAVDFSTSPPKSVGLLSLSQNVLIRDVETAVDPEDGSILIITWRAGNQCYFGQYNLVVSAFLSGRTATFDAPAFELVRLIGQRQSDSDQPDTGVSDIAITLEVESIDTSLISQILQDCKDATASAIEAASKASDTNEAVQEAEALRVEAENARAEAETARSEAETKRKTDENQRIEAEEGRQNAEKTRVDAEAIRVEAEDARKEAETARSEAEHKRQTAETARAAAEDIRKQSETERSNAEAKRVQNEQGRVEAEEKREEAEQLRQIANSTAVDAANTAAQLAEDAAQAANDAAELANQNVLAITFDQSTGMLSALYGADGSAFENGEINEKGEIVLEFNYQ